MKHVLFVCTHNAGRSQMAEPWSSVWPEVIEARREVGIDLAGKRPKKLLPEMQLHADWAITLACGATCPYVPTIVEDWDVHDPAGRSLEEERAIRDQVDLLVHDLLEQRLDAIRSDRTAHQQRLMHLLPGLIERFPDKPDEEIRSCADAVLAEYIDVPVRSFVMTIADRRARECLASGACALVA